MTVAFQIGSIDQVLTASVGPVTIPFQFFEIQVLLNSVPVSPSSYTISQFAPGLAGSITFTTPQTGTVTVKRVTSISQQTDYIENDDFPAETHERALDRLTMVCMDLQSAMQGLAVTGVDLTGITEIADFVDDEADFSLVFDTSIGLHRKYRAKNIGFTPAGTGALIRSLQGKLREQRSILDFIPTSEHAAIAAGTSTLDLSTYFQNANNAVSAAGGGTIYIPPGRYSLRTFTPSSLVSWRGAGMGSTTLRQITPNPADGVFSYRGTTPKTDIEISDFTIDVNSVNTGIYAEYVTNFAVRRIRTKNVPFWGILIGVVNGADATIRNTNVLVEDCVSENQSSTFEGVLIFNTQKATVRRCRFTGGATAPGVGIYQNVDEIVVEDNDFSGLGTGVYFAPSTNNIYIRKNRFTGCVQGIKGATASDNGLFGFDRCRNVYIDSNHFTLCTNIACLIGAIDGGGLLNNTFYRNVANSVVCNKGNTTGGNVVNSPVQNFTIANNKFIENNTVNTNHSIHPGIYFIEVGGSNLTLVGNDFFDNQGTPTQRNPITFDGAFTWSNIQIFGGRLKSYSGANSISILTGAALSAVNIFGARDVLNLPAGALTLFADSTGYYFDGPVTVTFGGLAQRVINNQNSASVQVVRFEGARPSGQADNDEAYVSYMLNSDAPAATEFARMTWVASDVNVGTSVDGEIHWSVAAAGALTKKLVLAQTALFPFASAGLDLGLNVLPFGNLFLKSAGLIDFGNNNVRCTHSTGALSFTGGTNGYTFDSAIRSGEHRVSSDIGGQASHTSITNANDLSANSTGVGTIKFKGATSRDSAGFIKIYIGTTAHFIPVFTAITG